MNEWFDTDTGILKPFPGAEGYGRLTQGGRRGRVIKITNLNDHGPGSLRAAFEAPGVRVIQDWVDGYVDLEDDLIIHDGRMSYYGQTAPGAGITLRSVTSHPKAGSPRLRIGASEVVIQYLRSRPGPPDRSSGSQDAMNIGSITEESREISNVYIDHSSLSWSTDELFATYGISTHDITIGYPIFSEPLNLPTPPHQKGSPHGYGALFDTSSENITLHHALFAHCAFRVPRVEINPLGNLDMYNCVIYNWLGELSAMRGHSINYMSNYLKAGLDSDPGAMMDIRKKPTGWDVYLDGNVRQLVGDVVRNVGAEELIIPDQRANLVDSPHGSPRGLVTDARQAYRDVLNNAGSSLVRDDIDHRIAQDVANTTGHIIDMPAEVGGYPPLQIGTPLPDSDDDGIPDQYWTDIGQSPTSDIWADRGDGVPHFDAAMAWCVNRSSTQPPPIDPPIIPPIEPPTTTRYRIVGGTLELEKLN